MTYNEFKLLCIIYLKPFEGKSLYELDFEYNNTGKIFHIENIFFDGEYYFECRYDKQISNGNLLICLLNPGFCRYNYNKGEFIPIEEFVLEDIV